MARIRSVKPEFFTSETVALLDRGARLTFIGLWTYVDDNGVGVFNEMLIAAALYPLDDPAEAVRWVREDLRSLSGAALVRLYRQGRKRYVSISGWREHQRISHPRAARYPGPDDEGCEALTCDNTKPPEGLRSGSGGTPEVRRRDSALSREQGAGSRDQLLADPADPATKEVPSIPREPDLLWEATLAACGMQACDLTKSSRGATNAAVKQLRDVKATPDEIHARARGFRRQWPNITLTPSALAKQWAQVRPVREQDRQQSALMRAWGVQQ